MSPLPLRTRAKAFTIGDKIEYNSIRRKKGWIEKFSPFFGTMEVLYGELEANEKKAILSSINDCYLEQKSKKLDSDELIEHVHTALLNKVVTEGSMPYTEQLDWSMNIVVVDGFTRCKILEEPRK